MLLFIALVLVGFFYVYRKGALNWSYEDSSNRRRRPTVPSTIDTVSATQAEPAEQEPALTK